MTETTVTVCMNCKYYEKELGDDFGICMFWKIHTDYYSVRPKPDFYCEMWLRATK